MRTFSEIKDDINNRFTSRTHRDIRIGSALDLFNNAVSTEISKIYEEIENSKNPHIYTNLSGENLDKLGYMVNVPRETNEDDSIYLYRLMNWTYLKASANETAINDSLLNMKYASNAQYYPGTYGAGTGTVYVIPLKYDEETIANALNEAKEKIKDIIDPAAYTEYVTPKVVQVSFLAQIYSESGDTLYIKSAITDKVKEYVNAIPPNEYMDISKINLIGLNTDNVNYFNVVMTYLDGDSNSNIRFLQKTETKYIFDSITWEEVTD